MRGSLIVFGAIIIIIGLIKMTGSGKSVGDVIMAPVSGTKTVAKTAKKVTGS